MVKLDRSHPAIRRTAVAEIETETSGGLCVGSAADQLFFWLHVPEREKDELQHGAITRRPAAEIKRASEHVLKVPHRRRTSDIPSTIILLLFFVRPTG